MSVAIILLLAIVGLTMLIVGVIGRRIDDHPVCRGCGFDLTGRPQGSDVCSECGADLNRKRAIRIGHRKRRDGWIALGGLLALLSLAPVGVAVSGVDVNKHKPFWWLAHDADSADGLTHAAALVELNARIAGGKLTSAQMDTIADRALAVQADLSKKWDPAWGDVLENAESAGKLSPERWQKYAKQAPQFSLIVRPVVTRGDALPYWLHLDNPRTGSRSTLQIELHGFEGKIGDATVQESSGFSGGLAPTSNSGFGSQVDLKPALDKLRDGPQTITIKLKAQITQRPRTPTAVVTIEPGLTAGFKLLPAGEKSAKFKHDDSLREAVEKVLKVKELSYARWGPTRLDTSISANGTPVDLAYDVFIRHAGGEKRIGGVSFGRGTQVGWGINCDDVVGLSAATVDVIFRPSLAVAQNTVDLFEPWDGEVVIRDVPVTYSKGSGAASRATTR